MTDVRTIVLTGYGLNCDYETAYAFEMAGSKAERVHINSLIDGSINLNDYQIMVFIGGFGWGDDHGAGVLQAVRMKTYLGEKMLAFIEKGNLVLGICNGFQALVNLGLLPGFDNNYHARQAALTFNDCGNFRNDWVNLKVNPLSPCVFTKGLDCLQFPIRHGEGKFYAEDNTINRLIAQNQVVLQYAREDYSQAMGKFPFNPNGSLFDIAGICDPTGRIFGLMPHPEAYNHFTNHPDWTAEKERLKRKGRSISNDLMPGVIMFKSGVDYMKQL